MGNQQILLLVLSVILIGVAITIGIIMFQSYTEQNHTDRIVMDLINIGSFAYSYRVKPHSMGGGEGSYEGFHNYFSRLTPNIRENSNGIYTCLQEYISDYGTHVSIRGVSAIDANIERWLLVCPDGEMTIHRPDEEAGFNGYEEDDEDEDAVEEEDDRRGRPYWAGGPPPWAGRPGGRP